MFNTTFTTTNTLTQSEVFATIARNREFYIQKVKDGIKYKLKKVVSRDTVEEVISDVTTDLLVRFHQGKIFFSDEAKVTGYVLVTAWRQYRDQNFKSKPKKSITLRGQDRLDDVFEAEAYQTFTSQQPNPHKPRVTSLDTIMAFMGSSKPSYYSEKIMTDMEGSETRSETDQDLTDAYYLDLYQKLFQYLENCITDNFLTFREVGIYKQYVINGYTMKQVVAESDFSRTICYDAIHKIKKHLRTVYKA